ncbi:uncharacterized protein LOC125378832 [Haliotis rufescens]|uniref:uncharacterized protein LOC125378832 n=1 Tax=Haliotis rufescens TaxID=6454 RepID=UPI00201F6BE8|nr:uncharacterized protein LOC125378832 [Haliotis rufescens]
MGLLTDFTRYGDPNNAVRFGLNQTWPAFTEPGEHYLLLNTTMSVQSGPFKDRVKSWALKLPRLIHALQNQHHTTNHKPKAQRLVCKVLVLIRVSGTTYNRGWG